MRQTPGIAGKVFQALGRSHVNISAIAQGSSELNISAVIKRNDKQKALRVIHDAFFYGNRKTVNIYMAGTGLIGKHFLKILNERKEWLLGEQELDFRINAVMNRRKMLVDVDGIAIGDWENQLDLSADSSSMGSLFSFMAEHQSPNTIFVDATAGDEIPSWYEKILQRGVSIVTPNKQANTASWEQFCKLASISKTSGAGFLYETNAGAGLPFIQTVRELTSTGDSIKKMEGVFSGTLSYLFNSFDGSMPFSELVKHAKEQGFTEPDPRDDLNGLDAARKLLILARLTGKNISQDDIAVENLVPENLRGNMTADVFIDGLKQYDPLFKERVENARKNNRVIRYLAVMDEKGCRVELKVVGQDHPSFFLSGTENMLAITSDAYSSYPLTIKGPGAGPDVTANGVLADIIKAVRN